MLGITPRLLMSATSSIALPTSERCPQRLMTARKTHLRQLCQIASLEKPVSHTQCTVHFAGMHTHHEFPRRPVVQPQFLVVKQCSGVVAASTRATHTHPYRASCSGMTCSVSDLHACERIQQGLPALELLQTDNTRWKQKQSVMSDPACP